MTREEAIWRIQDHMRVHHIGEGLHIYIKEALDMAIDALQELDKKKEQPLTLAELRKMHKETVYCLDLNADVKVTAPNVGQILISYNFPGDSGTLYARSLTLYRNKPKED